MGRRKIQIKRITDDRLRQVRDQLPYSQLILSVGHTNQAKEGPD
jgi:hypothetical protein